MVCSWFFFTHLLPSQQRPGNRFCNRNFTGNSGNLSNNICYAILESNGICKPCFADAFGTMSIYIPYTYTSRKRPTACWCFSMLPALPQHPQDAREPSESPAVPIERENDAPYAPNGYGYQRGWWFQTWLSLPMFIQKWGLSQARRQLW